MKRFQHKLSRKLLWLCTSSCFEELNVEEFSHGNCVNRYISKYSLHSFDKTKPCSFVSSRLLLYGQILLLRGQWKMDKEFDRSGTPEITLDLKSQIFFFLIILDYKGAKNDQPASIFVHLHPFSVVDTWAVILYNTAFIWEWMYHNCWMQADLFKWLF